MIEWALDYTEIARRYLKAEPKLYSVNAFWSRPSLDPPMQDLQTWHRDHDDERFIALFMYGTDVIGDPYGPHCFKLGSHRAEIDETKYKTAKIFGAAGTAFLADTKGLHLGIKPQIGYRLLLWARWCVNDKPWAYINDKLEPVDRALLGSRYPTDPVLQETIRMVVR